MQNVLEYLLLLACLKSSIVGGGFTSSLNFNLRNLLLQIFLVLAFKLVYLTLMFLNCKLLHEILLVIASLSRGARVVDAHCLDGNKVYLLFLSVIPVCLCN